MTKHVAVVGAQFGDEGKGLTTDYLCHKMMNELGTTNGLVVRYNSGAQAGHTVVTPEGWRHVHSHIGSGWNLEIPTYLSKHFVCNPFILLKEQQMGHQRLHIKADPRCLVTTHYDMFFNQVLEDARSQRHGSCGLGFNETIQRSRFVYFNVGDIENNPKLDSIMEMIHQYYIKVRIPQAAANDGINPKNLEKFYLRKVSQYSNAVMIHALRDLPKMLYLTTEMPTTDFVVFEGAQGLRLDQNYGEFPYVTRSNTGLQNVKQILTEFDRGILDEAVYVTRAYTTRHGNGYLPFERKWGHLFNGFDDKTNVTNGYQGEFRYAPSYPQEIVELVERDYWKHVDHNTKLSFMITCLDQLTEEIPMMYFSRITEDEDLICLDRDNFFRQFPFVRYASFGETRKDIISL